MLSWLGRFLRRLIVAILALIGGIVVAAAAIAALIGAFAFDAFDGDDIPERAVILIRVEGRIAAPSRDPLSRLLQPGPRGIEAIVDAFEAASRDRRIRGVLMDLSHARPGLGEAQEVRDAVTRFRQSGRFVIAFADTFGDFSGGTAAYYLASAADRVYLQPSGDLGLIGFALTSPFFRGALDRLGVATDFAVRHEYKGAAEIFTDRGFSDAVRQNLQGLLDGWMKQVVTGIAASRGLEFEAVRRAIDAAPLSAKEAQAASLVDRLMYRDEALTRARSGRLDGDAGREQATRDAELIELGHYLAKAELPNRQGPKIALIGAQGAVVRQGSPWEPGWGDLNIVGDTVARAIDDAAANPDIRAIVLRIESPGGSYVAADRIWRAVSEARQRKPVIASFGNVAASGGYFMSMAASKILAPPASITGSIGVFGGKFVVRDLVQSVGIDIDSVEAGRHAGMWRPDRPFDAEEKRRFAEALDRIYGDFTEKLAAARRLSAEDVDRVSRGRIWTGEEAQRVGLIDKLGGYHDALIEARIAASLAPDAPITIETYPRRKRWILSAVEALRQGRWLDGIEETIRATIGLLRLLRDISEFAPIS